MSGEAAATDPDRPVVIEVWADLGCPWCYVGKHRLEKAIAGRPDAERFVVKLRSFELNPDAPHTPETIESAFIRSHGGNAEAVLTAERRIQALAQREGLPFSLDRLNANTFDFHRVVHYADEAGKGLEFFSRAQDRFFAGEIDPFDPDALARVAEEVGLSGQRVREVLATDEYADAVRADGEEGRELGVQGVPFTVFDRRFAASGAQSVDVYAQALEQTVEASASDPAAG
ncbi:DsbA family oxidoreductase [Leifsonia virtsii]|uniref:DsbA family oxidoreductase n=1 Tax=Leifsonia virtsii TaxID=3035915 RepID=A0ABT8J445_9MICO|nr:DsbA family oxidoreductase [Leifsonia virtsii]MDN4599039.1 DsbA family oxidoreductase [Leifsonia virtsii]